jgi:hypothetical protein
MGFAPRLNANSFTGFWSCGSGWGVYSQTIKNGELSATLEIKYGTLRLHEFSLACEEKPAKQATVLVNGKPAPCRLIRQGDDISLKFLKTVELNKGQTLELVIGL